MKDKIKIGMIFGGRSVEHEVSVITAYQALKALNRQKYEPIPIYVARDNVWYIGQKLTDISFFRTEHPSMQQLTKVFPCPDASRGKLNLVETKSSGFRKPRIIEIDCVIPATHGTFGEDGCLQGLLEYAGVPYAGSDVRASSIGMDKLLTKAVLKSEGLPCLPYSPVLKSSFESNREQQLKNIEKQHGFPVIVKPAVLGSSVGITTANSIDELEAGLELALRFGERALVEKYIKNGREINCSVLDGDPPIASVTEQPVKSEAHLTFEDKYQGSTKGAKGVKDSKGMASLQRIIPAPLSDEQTVSIQDIAVKTFAAIGGGGVARIDFLMNDDDEIFVNEINNIPGSFSYYLWEYMGRSFTELLDRMIERAFEIRKRSHRTIYAFEANLLAGSSQVETG
ncbi:MAG: D-alanine--D-alanine ligase [Calditrichaeota bacterium]|nr:D-alanine--D-alanine ligase [Calditrichota bacterium]